MSETLLATQLELFDPSLAYTGRMVTAIVPLTCENDRDRAVMELYSGTVYPARCGSNICMACLPFNARRRALAITLAAPRRMIRISLVAAKAADNPWQDARVRIKRTRQALTRMQLNPGEWCYTVEPNPRGTGYHAHCLQTGDYIAQSKLQEACERAGAGFPHINEIKRQGVWSSRYGMKGFGADGYGMKAFRPNAEPAHALRINGNRVEHHTNAFFRYRGKVRTVREMEKEAIAEMNKHERKCFVAGSRKQIDQLLNSEERRHRMIAAKELYG